MTFDFLIAVWISAVIILLFIIIYVVYYYSISKKMVAKMKHEAIEKTLEQIGGNAELPSIQFCKKTMVMDSTIEEVSFSVSAETSEESYNIYKAIIREHIHKP